MLARISHVAHRVLLYFLACPPTCGIPLAATGPVEPLVRVRVSYIRREKRETVIFTFFSTKQTAKEKEEGGEGMKEGRQASGG